MVKWLYTYLLALATAAIYGQETPKIVNFSPIDYAAHNQNWSIEEGCDHNIYIANSDGVLVFNGFEWKLAKLPNNVRPRSIFVGTDCKVYVSGFEVFGVIEVTPSMNYQYRPVADSLLQGRNQEYWKVFGDTSRIIFQSFSEVFSYDFRDIREISTPTNIMLGTSAGDELILPKIESGVYTIEQENVTEKSYEYALPLNSKVIGVTDDFVFATQTYGLFRRKKDGYIPVNSRLNDDLKTSQINAILKMSNGYYVIGTILSGIYITRDLKEVLYHIDQSNGLSNNTVLSLYEDSNHQLWVGLDKGIDVIDVTNPILFHYDRQGVLGSVFTSIVYQGFLYLGTNKGIFKRNEKGKFDFIEGSQGQAWSLIEVDGDLLCGHNRGTFLVENSDFVQISDITGGWCMKQIGPHSILQSSYTGLVLLKKEAGQWNRGRRLEEGRILFENFELIDRTLLGYHPHFGLRKVKLGEDFTEVLDVKPIDKTIDQGGVILVQPSCFLVIDTEKDTLKIDVQGANVRDNRSYVSDYYGGIDVLSAHEPITNIRFNQPQTFRSSYIVGSYEGYILFPADLTDNIYEEDISIDYIKINDQVDHRPRLKELRLNSNENDLIIQFRANDFGISNEGLKYRLEGWEDQWFELPKNGKLVFNNLQDGIYSLSLSNGITYLVFDIAPKWYESWPGVILYILCSILALYLINKRQQIKLRKQKAKLDSERMKELESERIKAKNAELENEVAYKNKMLANSTMTLVQKNKMLIDLKQTLAKELRNTNHDKRRQILHLIEMEINSNDDWTLFETTFAEVHENYLETLKRNHPDITQGELRLAAYIKMDLSSKEIAPLMNISVRSIENKRYRLRKKLGIEDMSLKKYLQKI